MRASDVLEGVGRGAPRQRAGFSPERKPRAFAASNTCSIRPRNRDAVSALSIQIGFSTPTISSVVIASTGLRPEAHGVSGQGHAPLRDVFVVAPLWLVFVNVRVRQFSKGGHGRSYQTAGLNRINTLGLLFARDLSQLACSGEGHGWVTTESHLLQFPYPPEEENPTTGATRVDNQIETVSIGVAAWRGEGLDLAGTELTNRLGHTDFYPNVYPNARLGCWRPTMDSLGSISVQPIDQTKVFWNAPDSTGRQFGGPPLRQSL